MDGVIAEDASRVNNKRSLVTASGGLLVSDLGIS